MRPVLEESGITIDAGYTLDAQTNLRGGLNTHDSDTYRGLLDLSVSLDTEALGLWPGGTLFADFQHIRGESITDRHVGDLFVLSSNDGPSRSQLAEFWWEQVFFDGLLRVKLGKQDANADFATNDYGAEFVNSAPYMIAHVPIPTYPDPGMGAAVFLDPIDWMTIAAGVYDTDGSGTRGGLETALHGRDDSMTIAELTLRPQWNIGGVPHPGAYRLGGWYHSGSWDVFFNDLGGRRPPRFHRGNAGVYCSLDQMVFKEIPEDVDDEQGLGMFFQFGWA
ncbi:MAG: carbohydrate porin [Phycisphaerales bacterium]|nr:carbohydrate porin [Phycisphaerales bacterium]